MSPPLPLLCRAGPEGKVALWPRDLGTSENKSNVDPGPGAFDFQHHKAISEELGVFQVRTGGRRDSGERQWWHSGPRFNTEAQKACRRTQVPGDWPSETAAFTPQEGRAGASADCANTEQPRHAPAENRLPFFTGTFSPHGSLWERRRGS